MKEIAKTLLLLAACISGQYSVYANQVFATEDALHAMLQENEVNKHLLVLFPGYSVELPWAKSWAKALIKATPKRLQHSDILIYKGPDMVFYENEELPLNVAILLLHQVHYQNVTVVAHSSGSFPAHRLFVQIQENPELISKYASRIEYLNLDGGIGNGEIAFTKDMLALIKKGYAISVEDTKTKTLSANHSDMVKFSEQFPSRFHHHLMTLDTGCNPGAKWCLHDALINLKPHNPQTFDLKADYSQFNAEHPVNNKWMILP